MTDADEAAYFTDVLKRLDTLRARARKDRVLSKLVTDASESLGALTGYFIVDSRKRSRNALKK